MNMKKTMLSTAVALSLGVSATADAGTAGLTGVWTGTYVFNMFSPNGGPVGGSGVPQDWTWDFDAGTVVIENTTTFYASVWTARDVTFTDNGDGTYGSGLGDGVNMLFDWSVNTGIPVEHLWEVDSGTGAVTAVFSKITAGSPAFPGFSPQFSGSISAVPVPAAVWLMGSGLLGLVGIARRRKSQA